MLLGSRAIPRLLEELRARQHQLDRPLEITRSHCGENSVRKREAFASETAADERRDDVYVLEWQIEHRRDVILQTFHPLRRLVNRQLVAVPLRERRVRFHRIVELRRRCVTLVEGHCGSGKMFVDVAAFGLQRRSEKLLGFRALRLRIVNRQQGVTGFVRYANACSRGPRGLVGFSDDDRNLLPVMNDLGVLHRHQCLSRHNRLHEIGFRLREAGRVFVREDLQNAVNLAGCRRIDRYDFAASNRARHHHRVRNVLDRRVGRILRLARNFQPAVHAIDRGSDDGRAFGNGCRH